MGTSSFTWSSFIHPDNLHPSLCHDLEIFEVSAYVMKFLWSCGYLGFESGINHLINFSHGASN
jgi:hypothetical protein